MLTQPVSQVRLTNVALIKYKLHNKKFEIACYKNKAINWRNGIEKDLDEVLQINSIFTNASQGQIASEKELNKYFPNLSKTDIMKIILKNGELQVSEKERDVNLESIFKDITNIITEKCVHSISKRPISIDSVQKAIKDIHFAIKIDQNPKKQALECIKMLQKKFLLSRAEMQIQITCLHSNLEKLISELEQEKITLGKEINKNEIFEKDDEIRIKLLIEPSKYRLIDHILKNKLKDGIVEVLVQYVTKREVADIESAGTVNLEIRPDYKEGDELIIDSDEEEEEKINKSNPHKNKKNKKEKILGKNKEEIIHKKEVFEEEKIIIDKKESISDKKEIKCSNCKTNFENTNDFRTHCKSAWHNFNLKRKNEKLEPLSEVDFKTFELDNDYKTNKK